MRVARNVRTGQLQYRVLRSSIQGHARLPWTWRPMVYASLSISAEGAPMEPARGNYAPARPAVGGPALVPCAAHRSGRGVASTADGAPSTRPNYDTAPDRRAGR